MEEEKDGVSISKSNSSPSTCLSPKQGEEWNERTKSFLSPVGLFGCCCSCPREESWLDRQQEMYLSTLLSSSNSQKYLPRGFFGTGDEDEGKSFKTQPNFCRLSLVGSERRVSKRAQTLTGGPGVVAVGKSHEPNHLLFFDSILPLSLFLFLSRTWKRKKRIPTD